MFYVVACGDEDHFDAEWTARELADELKLGGEIADDGVPLIRCVHSLIGYAQKGAKVYFDKESKHLEPLICNPIAEGGEIAAIDVRTLSSYRWVVAFKKTRLKRAVAY